MSVAGSRRVKRNKRPRTKTERAEEHYSDSNKACGKYDIWHFYLCQWCTTSRPRAITGPRRVFMWPAMFKRTTNISDTALTLNPQGRTPLIPQHLTDLSLKLQIQIPWRYILSYILI